MSKLLRKTEFGDKILRSICGMLTEEQILDSQVQNLITDMYYTLERRKYGVGLAAPQVGKSLALSVIDTKPTPTRPNLKREQLTIINPRIVKTYGAAHSEWEGCVSGTELYAQVPRFKKIRLAWYDQAALAHEEDFEGFMAQVIQHEVDHLNGVLFVDRVKDAKSYMTFKEYRKMRAQES